MGKAKMFGGVAVIIGLILGILAYVLVHMVAGGSFARFLLYTFLPVILVIVALIAIIIGILLLVYG